MKFSGPFRLKRGIYTCDGCSGRIEVGDIYYIAHHEKVTPGKNPKRISQDHIIDFECFEITEKRLK